MASMLPCSEQSLPPPTYVQNDEQSLQGKESQTTDISCTNASNSNLRTATELPASSSVAKVTRSSRFLGSYDNCDAFPTKVTSSDVETVKTSYHSEKSAQFHCKEDADSPANGVEGNVRVDSYKSAPNVLVQASPPRILPRQANGARSAHDANRRQQCHESDGNGGSISQQTFVEREMKLLPQCRSRAQKFIKTHDSEFSGCSDSSNPLDQLFAGWSNEIDDSVANYLFGTGDNHYLGAVNHWATIVRIFYSSLTFSSSGSHVNVSSHVDEIIRNWYNLYHRKYISVSNQFHGKQIHNTMLYANASKSETASVCSVSSEYEKPLELSAPSFYFCDVLLAQLLWNEVCGRCSGIKTDLNGTSNATTENLGILSFHNVMNILTSKVKILHKFYPLHVNGQDDASTVTEGVLYYIPNEKCLAFGEFCWNTWARKKLSIMSNIWANPYFSFISACMGGLTPLDTQTPFDILSSPWCFQAPASSPIKDIELYAIQLLPLHCLNCILNESFWEREDASCHINFILLKTAQLLLENDFFFAGRIDSVLKHELISNTDSHECIIASCVGKVIEVILLYIKDCEAWFRLRCENFESTSKGNGDCGHQDTKQSWLLYSVNINVLINGYRRFLACLIRWSTDIDVTLQQDVQYQFFCQSFMQVENVPTPTLASIHTKIPKNRVLHVCGQAAHLFGQSLDNLRAADSRKSSQMIPNIREFYTAALKFHEVIVACPLSFGGEDDTHSLQENTSEDRHLTSERSLVLIHLGCIEENATDFVKAIACYKEALAILRNSALWRYNIPFISGSHWGDDNDDDDGSTNSNIDCRSDLSGSITSSHSTSLNVTHSSYVSLALHRMGICYVNTGEYKAAAECLRKAVELRKKELVDPTKIVDATFRHSSTTRREREVDLAESLLWLATAYREENSPDKAYEILRDCMIVKLLLFGKNNIEVANVQFNMGIILGDLSRHEESLECYREALSVQRYYANEKDVANTLLCMGNVFLRVHIDYQNALECFLEALLMLDSVVGLESVAFNIDEAKCLGGVKPYHIFSDAELETMNRIERQEKYYNYDRMIHYYTISLDIVSNRIDDFIGLGSFFKSANSRRSDFKDQVTTYKVFILEGLSKVYMAQMKWKSALEVLQRKLKILRRCWEENSSKCASNENQLIDKEYEKTLYNVAHMLFKLRSFQPAEQCYNDVLESRRADSRSSESAMACGVADALHNKGRCYEELSLLNDAIQCYEESLEWRNKAGYDENRLESLLFKANTIFHLGSTHLLQNKCEKAKELFDQCMETFEMDGNHTLSEAFVLQCIGKLHHLKKELPSALECYSRSLQIYRDAIGHDENLDQALAKELAVYIAEAFHNIGVIHDTQKQYSLALVNYEDALKLYRAKYKTGHCLIATTLNNMGLVLMQKQGFSEALVFFEEALHIRKEQLGEDHADVGQIWHNLGLVHGKLALQKGHSSLFQAIECFKQALRIRLPCHGQVNLEVSNTWNNLGIAYKSLNDYDNAIGCFVKVIQIREELLGCDHVEVGNANHNLGNLYAKAGNFSKALEAYEASYKTRLHTYGQNHLSIANTLHNMGNVYFRMGNKEKARDLYNEALKMRDSNLSSSENSKADLANSLHKVAQLEVEAGQYNIALTHFERSLELKRLVYGDSHIHLATTLKASARIYLEIKQDYKKAISSYTELLRVLKWNRGENDVEVAHALNSLGYIYSNNKCDQYNLVMAVKYQEDAMKCLPRNTEDYAKALCNIVVCYLNLLKSEDHHTAGEMTIKAIHHVENCIAVYENISQEPESSTNTEKMLGLAQSVYYKGVLHMQLSTLSKNSDEDQLAIDCFEDSLAIFRELLKIDCSTYASESSNVMQKLGMMWIKRRDYDIAMSYFESALKVQEESLHGDFDGDEKKDLADIYYGMGVVLCERRDRNYEEAMECYKKCLKTRVLALGPHHIDVAQTLNNIGSVYARLNKFSDAKDYWTRALEIYRFNKLHDDDEKVKCTLSNMELANKLVILPTKPARRRSSKKLPPVKM